VAVTTTADPSVLDQIRRALSNRDLQLLAPILADDVTWGDVADPRGCRDRTDVLDTFSQLMELGVEGDVAELAQGDLGILCELSVRWPVGMAGPSSVWQVYLLRDDKVAEIRGCEDRQSARRAAGLS